MQNYLDTFDLQLVTSDISLIVLQSL